MALGSLLTLVADRSSVENGGGLVSRIIHFTSPCGDLVQTHVGELLSRKRWAGFKEPPSLDTS